MSNQERSPFDPQEPEGKTAGDKVSPPGPAAPEPPAPPPPPSRPAVELERYERVPSPDAREERPVETFVREDVLPSFSDRRPAVPPPPPAAPQEQSAPPPPRPAAPPPPGAARPVLPAPPSQSSAVPPPPPAAAQVQNAPPPPVRSEPDASQPPEEDAAVRQLAALKARNKQLKFILAGLTGLVLLIAAAAAFLYNKIASFFPSEETYQSGAMESFPENALKTDMAPPAGGPSAPSGGSTLFLIRGGGGQGEPGLPAGLPRVTPQQMAGVSAAMAKYAERPLVKEFLADMNADPQLAGILDPKKPDPAAYMKLMRNPAAMNRLLMKYAERPEFMALLMELVNDPAMKPLLSGAPAGPMPAGIMPPGPVPAGPPPARAGDGPSAPGPGPDGAEPRLDTGVISGTSAPRKVPVKPVPVP